MTTIIAGGFERRDEVEAAVQRLREAGLKLEAICTFHVNPPGEHHQLPEGGDRDKSPGAEHADRGAVKGAVIGAAVGLAAGAAVTPLLGPAGIAAGAGVGAYTGSLVGALTQIDHEAQPDKNEVRPAEEVVAINVGAIDVNPDLVIRILETCGAQRIERAEGRWEQGCWADFDPTSQPKVIYTRPPVVTTRGTSARGSH